MTFDLRNSSMENRTNSVEKMRLSLDKKDLKVESKEQDLKTKRQLPYVSERGRVIATPGKEKLRLPEIK